MLVNLTTLVHLHYLGVTSLRLCPSFINNLKCLSHFITFFCPGKGYIDHCFALNKLFAVSTSQEVIVRAQKLLSSTDLGRMLEDYRTTTWRQWRAVKTDNQTHVHEVF